MDMIIQLSVLKFFAWSFWTTFLKVRGIEVALVAGSVTEGVIPGQRVSNWPELVGFGNHSALPREHNQSIINTTKIERERKL